MTEVGEYSKTTLFFEILRDAASSTRGITFLSKDGADRRIPYSVLYKRSLALASHLKKVGVERGDYVVFNCCNLELEIILFWACSMIGAVSALLAYRVEGPSSEVTDLLGQYWIASDVSYGSTICDKASPRPRCIDLSTYDLAQESAEDVWESMRSCAGTMDDPCCCLFSSGTTAAAKAILLTGHNVDASVFGEIHAANLTADSRILVWMPFHHCGGLVIHYLTASVLSCDLFVMEIEAYSSDPLFWLRCLSDYRISFAGTISSALNKVMLLYQQKRGTLELDLSALRLLSVGAENVNVEACRLFEESFEQFGLRKNTVVPTYGLTEATCLVGWSFHDGFFETYEIELKNASIGSAVFLSNEHAKTSFPVYTLSQGVGARIVYEDGRPMEPGHIGCVELEGSMVISNYLVYQGRLEPSQKDGWFRTGDIGFLTSEGRLGIVGRLRDQLKVNGEFFSAAQIEGTVRPLCDGRVDDVYVSEVQGESNRNVVGVFVLCPRWIGDPDFATTFNAFARELIALVSTEYGHIPCEVFPLERAPETDSRKIKRYALISAVDEKILERLRKTSKHMECSNSREKQLLEIIKNITKVCIDDRDRVFSAYGIESRVIPNIAAAISDAFNIPFNSAALYKYPTIATLCTYIDEALAGQGDFELSQPFSKTLHQRDPIAIVGMACRFPGDSNSPEEFWDFLISGKDGIVEIPDSRWKVSDYYSSNDDALGKMYYRHAGLISAPYKEFDANFFNISPLEASSIDPHGRLLLELTWEAFENGGMDISCYAGTKTGVFLGMVSDEYGFSSINSGDLSLINSYSLTGACFSTICGRLSYIYDFQGPCFSLDTACSSFLTALHLAAESISSGDSEYAVVGSASLLLTPVTGVAFSKIKAVCHDGHSKTFDDSADGYGRGEGAGVVVLKPLSKALKDHDYIWGLLRASGINQDGKSNGLAAPNGESQSALIMDTLVKAKLSRNDIDYVEAHGTGTALGDPIEVDAIQNAYCGGEGRTALLHIGSVKSNIGHLEPVSGAASLMKVLLSMKHGVIPGNRNYNTPNHLIDWDDKVKVVDENIPWEPMNHPRRASINSFGFGGSNAHVIVEEHQEKVQHTVRLPDGSNSFYILKLSAKSAKSLRDLARAYSQTLKNASQDQINDIIYTLNCGRADLPQRIAVCGHNVEELINLLDAYVAGKKALGLFISPQNYFSAEDVIFMFTGQSSQYVNMARYLYDNESTFKNAFDACDSLFRPLLLTSLYEAIYGNEATSDLIDQTEYAQPLIFTIEYALALLWISLGVPPNKVMGHSIGEYPAAVIAGIFDLETAVNLVAIRARLMGSAEGRGTMMSVFATEDKIEGLIADLSATVSIAAINAPELCVVSGEFDDVIKVKERAEAEGIRTIQLRVSSGFHSALMKPAADKFYALINGYEYKSPKVPFLSSMFARELRPDEVGADYWSHHICRQVLYRDTLAFISNPENQIFLEIGGTNSLTSLCRLNLGNSCHCVASLNPKAQGPKAFYEAVASMYVLGCNIDWSALNQHVSDTWRRIPSLPTYPFERQHFWNDLHYDRKKNNFLSLQEHLHGLLGQRIESPVLKETVVFQSVFTSEQPCFISEHIIYGRRVCPAAGYISMLISAMGEVYNPASIDIFDVELRNPLIIETRNRVQLCFSPAGEQCVSFQIISDEFDAEWKTHCTGKITYSYSFFEEDSSVNLSDWNDLEYDEFVDGENEVYSIMREAGFNLGIHFRRLRQSLFSGSIGHSVIDPEYDLEYSEPYVLYPGTIDSIFHTMLCSVLAQAKEQLDETEANCLIPYFVESLSYNYVGDAHQMYVRSDSRLIPDGPLSGITASSYVLNENGQPLMHVKNMITKLTTQDNLFGQSKQLSQHNLYRWRWDEICRRNGGEPQFESVCLISDGDNDMLAKLEDYVTVPFRAVTYESAEQVTRESESLPGPILYLFACGFAYSDSEVESAMRKLFEFIKAHDTFMASQPDLLRIVTHNAVSFRVSKINLAQSLLWGFAKSFCLEARQRFLGIVDVDDGAVSNEEADVLLYGNAEEVCFRKGKTYACHMVRSSDYVHNEQIPQKKTPIYEDATYLIAGGSGFVGKAYLEALVNKGARHIGILGRRSTLPPEFKSEIAEHVEICYFSCDITNYESVCRTMEEIAEVLPPIKGVINASGVFRDEMLADMAWCDFSHVLAPKVAGSMNLYWALQGNKLDFFHMVSSITAMLGNLGQTSYGAANHFFDNFACYLCEQGISGSVIMWGPWKDSAVVSSDIVVSNMETSGIYPVDKGVNVKLIEDFFGKMSQSCLAAHIDWQTMVSITGTPQIRELLKDFISEKTKSVNVVKGDYLASLTNMNREVCAKSLMDQMKGICCTVMGYDDISSIDENSSFQGLGADSLMIFTMRNKLNELLDGAIELSDFYNYPSLHQMCTYILDEVVKVDRGGNEEGVSLVRDGDVDIDSSVDGLERLLNE